MAYISYSLKKMDPWKIDPMDKLLLSYIHILIVGALLFFTRTNGFVESSLAHPNDTVTSCIAGERVALVLFKAGLSDHANLLSSWKSDDCCKWKGVHCSRNNHVVKLDLRGHGCDCSGCTQVLGGNISSSLLRLRHLQYLNLSCNGFSGVQIPQFLSSIHKLRYIDLHESSFIGRIPPQMGNLSNLRYLNLASGLAASTYSTDITWLSKLTSLEHLDLGNVGLGTIVHWVPMVNMLPSLKVLRLRNCNLRISSGSLKVSNLTSLETLDLSGNSFHIPISPNWFLGLTSLKYLDIAHNGFYGEFPNEIGNMTSIVKLDLSLNNLVGMIPSNLQNQCSLEEFIVHGNNINGSITEFILRLPSCSWNKLSYLYVPSSNLTGSLPTNLEPLGNLISLDLRSNKLTGHVPLWIGELSNLIELDLSSNQFNGPIPKLPSSLHVFDLSRNNLEGPLMLDFEALSLKSLILSDNSISGTMPSSLCKLQSLHHLDISENNLTGSIPDCFVDTSTTNMASMSLLNLNLRNNNLSGEFPSFLQHCQHLVFLDLSQNHFFGTLPTWIGKKLPDLAFLRLRSNMFYGHIPEEITKLVNLQYLDLANNNITGSIPKSIGNCKGMRLMKDRDGLQRAFYYGFSVHNDDLVTYTENFTVVIKGQERLYTGEIIYMVNLDLSCNNLIGGIPEEISTLVELKNLNLSWNTFSGKIPENVGALVQVESLDLSHNDFSGEIPASLSALTSLSRLNLSYNNLTGEVPAGDQLQTLEDLEHIYIGNPGLCGPPLLQKCSQAETIPAPQEHHEDLNDEDSFFRGMGSGYEMCLWVLFCTFLFKRKWRVIWYSVCDSVYDWVYVEVAVTWASWTREQ